MTMDKQQQNLSEEELSELSGEGFKQCPSCGRLYHSGRKTCDRCGAHVLPPPEELELVKDEFRKIGTRDYK